MSLPDLKPCPFCGSAVEEYRDTGGFYNYYCTNRKCKCSLNCNAEHHMTARKAWNTRPNPPASKAATQWLPIEGAPEMTECVVRWMEDGEVRHALDYKEGDVWSGWAEHYEHFIVVAKPEGSIGPKETPPYKHYMSLAATNHPANTEKPSTEGSAVE